MVPRRRTAAELRLVELKLENDVKYWTDSAGVAALDEPSLRGRDVFLGIRSHGYEYPSDTILGRAVKVRIDPGTTQEVRIRRTMIAERLYRLTGEGIYRDSVMAGLPVPANALSLNAHVLGQDTVSAAVYRGRIFWIWGDTIGTDYWNFSVSAATSDLRDDPAVAVNYRYFTNGGGSSKPLCVEMPVVRARPGERVVLPSGEVAVGSDQGDALVLIGLMGSTEIPFLLRRVGDEWKVVPQKYFEMLRKSGAI